MPRVPTGALYDTTIAEVFHRLELRDPGASYMAFDKPLIEDTIDRLMDEGELPKRIKNIPDIKYTYDARRSFPNSISEAGHWAIIGRGKSKYAFVRLPQENLIEIPASLPVAPEQIVLRDTTPPLVSRVIGDDEQATLTRIRYSDALSQILGFDTHQVQSHHRTTVSAGQIEVDEVYVGSRHGTPVLIPISAKGGNDRLSYTQALNLNLYGAEKTAYDGYHRIPLGLVRLLDGGIAIIEFSDDLDVAAITIRKSVVVTLT